MTLLDTVKTLAEAPLRHTDDPDFDWYPVLFLHDDEEIHICGFDPKFLGHKSYWRQVLTTVSGEVMPQELVLLTSAWSTILKREENETDDEFVQRGYTSPPSQRRDKKEVLWLTYVAANGDEACAWAEIQRDGVSAPTLGEWEDHDARIMGPTIDALRMGLR